MIKKGSDTFFMEVANLDAPQFRYPLVNDFTVANGKRDSDMSEFLPSLTRQEFAEECDINTLMARYEKSGVISHVNKATPRYMDVAELPDLRGYLDIMREASLSFASLPAKVRKEFDNDPQKFVDFAQTPENLEKMREWGLAPMPVEVPSVRVKIDKDEDPAPPAPPPLDTKAKP